MSVLDAIKAWWAQPSFTQAQSDELDAIDSELDELDDVDFNYAGDSPRAVRRRELLAYKASIEANRGRA